MKNRILVLEDHPCIFYVLEMVIKEISQSIEIVKYSKWEAALDYLREMKPDFVITDIQIGDYKQLEIITECNELKTPCMVFTSHINSTILEHCVDHKVQVVVAKSSPIKELKFGVHRLIHRQVFRCELCSEILNAKGRLSEKTPKVIFTPAQEFVILAQIEGKSTI